MLEAAEAREVHKWGHEQAKNRLLRHDTGTEELGITLSELQRSYTQFLAKDNPVDNRTLHNIYVLGSNLD